MLGYGPAFYHYLYPKEGPFPVRFDTMDHVTKAIDELNVGDQTAGSKDTLVEVKDGEKGEQDKEGGPGETREAETGEAETGETETGETETGETETEKDTAGEIIDLVCPPDLDIGFKVPYDDEYTSPYISLGSGYQKSYDRCLELDEIVIPCEYISTNTDDNKFVTLWLDYPLDDEYSFKIYPEDASKGFTRGHLIREIKRTYDKLYAEEEETSSLPVENIPGMLNRATTDGNYGVWGHALDDLVLHTISYNYAKNEIWLGIDS
ncbi:hypothetical protein BKA91DRAFT_141381 [Yarrowia lipolytica]|nr:hypothetical protein BKA91DRAFT_141381 [Yarrowia lipolytica]KAE8169851.1 hypothetical protein BKA90DRAFT_141835 [Yarrowia lipolytica]RMI94392.1 hypothetical protein BD777DRAFT_131762 [Yarrowia lipolytica]